jgi:L-malate glycosyltransferase
MMPLDGQSIRSTTLPLWRGSGWTRLGNARMLAPMPARVALLAPFASPSVRGNAVTVERIVRGLREHGADVGLWDLSVMPPAAVQRQIEAFRPAIVHAFHAWRTGPLALGLARRAEVPLIVTLTGTDANHDLFDAERAAVVRRVLEGASRVTVFHETVAALVAATLPDVGRRIVIVPQSASPSEREAFDLGSRWTLPPSRTLFVLPAAIRPVKRPRFPLAPLARLASRSPDLRLLFAGPVLDPDEGDALLGALAPHAWARYIGTVPHAQMASLLGQADVVLNCSMSEGGMANSVLEAFAMSRAVLAADIPGNRSLVEHDVTGLLFADEAGFEAAAARLAADGALRGRLGAAGRALLERRYPPRVEIDGYLALYRAVAPVTA